MSKIFYSVLILFYFLNCATARTKFLEKDYTRLSLKLKVYPKNSGFFGSKKLPSIVLYEPVLLNKDALFRVEDDTEKGLIPFLNNKGYDVFVTFNDFKTEPNLKAHALELGEILESVRGYTGNDEIILGGLSLGGQAVINYLALPQNENSKVIIPKIFFIGVAGDYNYPNNFVDKMDTRTEERTYLLRGCYVNDKNTFCNKFVKNNNSNENLDSPNGKLTDKWKNYVQKKIDMIQYLPMINKEVISQIDEERMKIPMFIAYGKIDNISPEEAMYPLIKKSNPENLSGWELTKIFFKEAFTKYKKPPASKVLELSRANSHSLDYDHFDLFLYEKKGVFFDQSAENDLYCPLVKWLKK